MELDSKRCRWSLLSLVLFLAISSATDTYGERDVDISSFKPAFVATSQNYYAEGGGLQSNHFSSISKRKVTARKEASPLTSLENITTDLRPQMPAVNSETNLENGNGTKISQSKVLFVLCLKKLMTKVILHSLLTNPIFILCLV